MSNEETLNFALKADMKKENQLIKKALNIDEVLKIAIYKLEIAYNIMSDSTRENNLANFVAFLKDEMKFDFESIKYNLDTRIHLQKYVFFAPFFDWRLGYEDTFSLYHYGPYSPALAHDYFKLLTLEETKQEYNLPANFKKELFKMTLNNRDTRWLELAATAKSIFEANRTLTNEQLANAVSDVKGRKYRQQDIIGILKEATTLLS